MQMSNFVLLLFAVLVIICGCDARSTIDERSELVDEAKLVSAGGNFAMGFFQDDAMLNWYVGIWYNRPGYRIIVWVANWNDSIADSTRKKENASMVIKDGKLKVLNISGYTYFSSGVDDRSGVKAELLDTGNLVLFDESGTKVWESFRNPTNTFLPGMNMENLEITSWVESGNWKYKFKVDKKDNKEYVIVENGVGNYWQGSVGGFAKSTAYEFFRFNDMPSYVSFFLSNNSDENEVLRCMNVALLCVQEDPTERPVMSNVVFMLGGESITLPRPNQPAFIARRNSAGASTSSSSSKLYNTSNNGLTITEEVGR